MDLEDTSYELMSSNDNGNTQDKINCLEKYQAWTYADDKLEDAILNKNMALMITHSFIEQKENLKNYFRNIGISEDTLERLIDDRIMYPNDIPNANLEFINFLGESKWNSFCEELLVFFKKYDDAMYNYINACCKYEKADKKCTMTLTAEISGR